MNDLKFAFRQLFKNPGGTFIILATLALVTGATCLALAVIQHEREAWMPFPDPDRVVRLWHFENDDPREDFPPGVYADAAERIQVLEAVAGLGYYGSKVLTGEGDPRSISVQEVSPSVFDVAGIQPALGRVFTQEEVQSGNDRLLVIGHELWRSVFEGDESAVGKSVTLGEEPWTIVGIMPEEFEHNALFYGLSAWIPKNFHTPSEEKGRWVKIVGRLKPDVDPKKLDAELQSVVPPFIESYANEQNWDVGDVGVFALRADRRPGIRIEGENIFMVAIPLFVLGIAGFNIANILLGRMIARRQEFAVRFSLGANRRRLVRQLLGESVLLALIGAALGACAAHMVGSWLESRGVESQFSLGVLALTGAASAVIGLAVGWLPALRATHGDFVSDLKDAGLSSSGGSATRHRLRNVLVIGQVAMATALCLGAGLLIRSYINKKQFEPPYDPDRLLLISASVNEDAYPDFADRSLYVRQAMERIAGLPGVEDVSLTSDSVVNRYPFHMSFRFDGQDSWAPGQRIRLTAVSPNHLDMVKAPILRGRPLQESDGRGGPPVLVVNQSFADRFFADRDPIGQRIRMGIEDGNEWFTVIGVISDRRDVGRDANHGPEGYLSVSQFMPKWASTVFLVNTRPDPIVMRDAIREAVRSVDRNVPVRQPQTMTAAMERAVQWNEEGTKAMTGTGLFGLVMALLGIYGVIAYSVTERTREMGVRMALGASRGDVMRLIVRQGMRFTLIGLGAGLCLGGGITFGIREVLYEIGPFDPFTYSLVAGLFLLTAFAATYFPAHRATRIDPMNALRHE